MDRGVEVFLHCYWFDSDVNGLGAALSFRALPSTVVSVFEKIGDINLGLQNFKSTPYGL